MLIRQWTTKAPTRLCRFTGSSAPLLLVYAISQALPWRGSYVESLKDWIHAYMSLCNVQVSHITRKPALGVNRPGKLQTDLLGYVGKLARVDSNWSFYALLAARNKAPTRLCGCTCLSAPLFLLYAARQALPRRGSYVESLKDWVHTYMSLCNFQMGKCLDDMHILSITNRGKWKGSGKNTSISKFVNTCK